PRREARSVRRSAATFAVAVAEAGDGDSRRVRACTRSSRAAPRAPASEARSGIRGVEWRALAAGALVIPLGAAREPRLHPRDRGTETALAPGMCAGVRAALLGLA